jgi:putative iron-regulated protein
MTTRRKTWMGVGLFAIAGTALPAATQTALATGNTQIQATGHAADKLAPLLFAQAGGEQGGEGGMAAPESYALPDAKPPAYDAKPEIAAYAAGVRASYLASIENAKTMSAAIDALLANPSAETLAAARKAWTAARPSYLVTESYRFYDGPIEDVEGEINSWPMNEAFIDYVVGNDKAGIINDTSKDITIANLIVDNQASDESDVTLGWHAIEFLLWGQDLSATGPGDRPYTDYVAGQGNNDRRRTYLKLVTDRMIADIQRVADAWDPASSDSYATAFQNLPQVEAIGRILNGIGVLAGSELMSERMAVGLDSGDQEDEHSCFSDTTHQDFVYDVKGIENVWTGKFPNSEGPGMRDLVAKADPAIAGEVDALLADATAKIAATGDPWDQVLAASPDSQARKDAEAAVASLGALAEGIKRAGEKLGVLVQIPSGG